MEILLTRRSVRKYTADPVSDELVNDILRAAMCAPSAGNQQPWHFVIIRSKATLQKISEIHPTAKMASQANLAILVCGDESAELHKGYWVQDCSAATENILLAAHAKGLGGVWVGVFPREERVRSLRSLIKAPPHIIPFALVPIGYPAENKEPVHEMDSTKVHSETW